jgi:hypothetical protein
MVEALPDVKTKPVARRSTRLVDATLLAAGCDWRVAIRPRCGEATIYQPAAKRAAVASLVPDVDRSRREAARRAAVMVRRLATEHGLSRMWTLTVADGAIAKDRAAVAELVHLFSKRMARRWRHLKWLAVLEPHPGGHGYHVHMLVSQYIPKELVREVWGHGHTDVRLITGRGVKDPRSGARRAAGYAAKYMAKEFDGQDVPRGTHRYLRREGMDITTIEADGDWVDLVRQVWAFFGHRVSWVWWSGDDDQWRGPRVLAVRSG